MSGIVAWARQAILIAAFGLAAGALAIAPVQAQVSYTYGIGGPGGALFDDPCRDGDVLVGFNYSAGKALNSVGPVCQGYRDGHLVNAQYGLHTWGQLAKGGGIEPQSGIAAYRCPPDQAIIGFHVWYDGNGIVHHVRAICRGVTSRGGETYLKKTGTSGGVAVGDAGTQCPNGAFAIGMTGYYGALIDKLGLKCNTFEVADTAPADNTPPPPPVDNTPPPQNNPPDASTRTAATATTIYDQPEGSDVAYLDAGDSVTIVSCEDGGAGWCRISKPKKGYVWGGDLN